MDLEQIREYCISKPGVTKGFPFNDTALVFKVAGKMFALLDLSEDSRGISLKCDPELAIELREQHPDVAPAWHFNKITFFRKSLRVSFIPCKMYSFLNGSQRTPNRIEFRCVRVMNAIW